MNVIVEESAIRKALAKAFMTLARTVAIARWPHASDGHSLRSRGNRNASARFGSGRSALWDDR